MYCSLCGPSRKAKWLAIYENNRYGGLLCHICILLNIYNRLITLNEFMQDQYLAEIVCDGITDIYYIDKNFNKRNCMID